MSEKIKKWEEEIDRIKDTERKMIDSNRKRIRELKRKIEEEEIREERENNRMIASVVKEFYGEVTEENIEKFKEQMASLGNSAQGMNGRM